MESMYAVFDGEKLVTEKKMDFKKGQKVILTILSEDEISDSDESSYSYATAIKSGAFNYLFQEGEEEYNAKDCKINFK